MAVQLIQTLVVTSPAEVVARIREYLDRHPEIRDDPTRWIEGAGFDHTGFVVYWLFG